MAPSHLQHTWPRHSKDHIQKKKPEHKAKYTSITTQHPHPKGSKQTLEPRECTTYTHQGNRQSTPRTRHYKQCLPQASPQLLPRGQYSSQPGMRAFFSRQPLCQDLRKVNTSAVLNLTNATDHPPLQQTAARALQGALHTSHSGSSIPPGADPPHTVRAEIKIHHHPHTKWTCVPWHTLPATGKRTPLTSLHRLSTPGPLNLQEDLRKPLPRGHRAHTPANPIAHLLHPIKKYNHSHTHADPRC